MRELRIGFMGVKASVIENEINIKVFEDSKHLVRELSKNHMVEICEEILIDTLEGQRKFFEINEKWCDARFDLIIVQSVGFGLGIAPVELAISQKDTHIVLWALPEPDLREGVEQKRNSWCGINMHASHLNKIGVKFEYIYGFPDDLELISKLKEIIRVFEVIKKLRKSTIGAFGSRVPGYYDSNFDELSLRKALGIRFEFFDLAQVFSEFSKIKDKEVMETVGMIYPFKKINVDEYIQNSIRLYISIKRLIQEYNLSALSIKCWPDMENILNIMPCSVISRLGDDGIPTACEGDMLGTVSMLILNYFNEDVTSLMDIYDFDFKRNAFLIFHCGSCPTKMAVNKSVIEHKQHSVVSTHVGIVNEFGLKPGKCGILRLREDNIYRNKYKIFFAEGEGLIGPNLIRGNTLMIKVSVDLNKFIENIIYNGFEHHWAFGYNINKDMLLKFCDWLNIETCFS